MPPPGNKKELEEPRKVYRKVSFFFFPIFFNSCKEQFTVPAFLQVSILEVTAASGWRRSGAKPVCKGRMRPRADSERWHSLRVSAANPQEPLWERDSSHHPELSLTMTFEIIFKDFSALHFSSKGPYVFYNLFFFVHNCILQSRKCRQKKTKNISLFVFFLNFLLKRHHFGQPLQRATTSLAKSPSSPAHAMISTPCSKGGCCCRARWPRDTAGIPLAGSQATGLLLSPPTDALGWQWCPPACFLLTPAGVGGRQLAGKAANDCHPKEGL